MLDGCGRHPEDENGGLLGRGMYLELVLAGLGLRRRVEEINCENLFHDESVS